MLVDVKPEQTQLILGAMQQVATARRSQPLADGDHTVLAAAHHYLFRATDDLDPATLPDTIPVVLGAALDDPKLADHAAQLLTAMALVGGAVDEARLAVVEDYGISLGVSGGDVRQLADLGRQTLQWVVADAQRNNVTTIAGDDDQDALDDPTKPYTGTRVNGTLAARYDALGDLGADTFGRAFFDLYRAHDFAFPGADQGLDAKFATPHDSTHVLSAYDTSPQGEVLVSAFGAAMHPGQPMSGHLLPVIVAWRLAPLVAAAGGSLRDALDPEAFFGAWTRGEETTTDVFDEAWDFWGVAARPLAELQAEYQVGPLP